MAFFSPPAGFRQADTAWQHGAAVEQITTHMSQGPPLSIFFLKETRRRSARLCQFFFNTAHSYLSARINSLFSVKG